ncbi:fibronectin type III domain-containing protein [bacterium 210820-DFI.6.37]|nr:fibronectin type III domain-containing protein [bacterium 210820-DFI.6.37]
MQTKEYGTQASKKLVALLAILALVGSLLMPVSTQAISKPTQVKSLKVTAQTTSSIKVSWKKVKNAKGYQIYRSTSKNGKYSKVKTIKSGKTVSWTNKSLKAGKKYYYKVRAYKTYKKKGKTKYLYGKYSTKKAVSTKIKLSKTSMTLTAGGSAKLTATSSTSVSWSTSNSKVARYNKSAGKVIAVSAGSATITAKASSGASASCRVFVREAAPSDPTPIPEPTPVPTPTEPTKETYLYIIDTATGEEVTTLQAGTEYQIKSSNTSYIGTSASTVGTTDDENKATQICYRGRASKLYPVSKGTLYLSNKDGLKKSYEVTKGATITTGGKTIELGGAVPSGYSESYATIYGNTQYVYNKDTENLVLVGAENGKAKTVFTMGSYSVDTNESYLTVNTTSFGGATIQPIRYYSDRTPSDKILSGTQLDNLGKEASLISSALRVKNGLTPMTENATLAAATKENVVKVYNYYGNSQKLDSNVHMISSLDTYEAALTPINYKINAENAVWGSYGAVSVAVSAVEALYDSAGHRAWMFHEDNDIVGSAFMYDGNNYICMLQSYAYAK